MQSGSKYIDEVYTIQGYVQSGSTYTEKMYTLQRHIHSESIYIEEVYTFQRYVHLGSASARKVHTQQVVLNRDSQVDKWMLCESRMWLLDPEVDATATSSIYKNSKIETMPFTATQGSQPRFPPTHTTHLTGRDAGHFASNSRSSLLALLNSLLGSHIFFQRTLYL